MGAFKKKKKNQNLSASINEITCCVIRKQTAAKRGSGDNVKELEKETVFMLISFNLVYYVLKVG